MLIYLVEYFYKSNLTVKVASFELEQDVVPEFTEGIKSFLGWYGE
jgi:hypothetical protein